MRKGASPSRIFYCHRLSTGLYPLGPLRRLGHLYMHSDANAGWASFITGSDFYASHNFWYASGADIDLTGGSRLLAADFDWPRLMTSVCHALFPLIRLVIGIRCRFCCHCHCRCRPSHCWSLDPPCIYWQLWLTIYLHTIMQFDSAAAELRRLSRVFALQVAN